MGAQATRQAIARSSMMIRRDPAFTGPEAIGVAAAPILSSVSGISDVRIESQYVDRANLSFIWDLARSNFDFRPDFERLDAMLQTKGMRRMQ
jgi:hypothetical protein